MRRLAGLWLVCSIDNQVYWADNAFLWGTGRELVRHLLLPFQVMGSAAGGGCSFTGKCSRDEGRFWIPVCPAAFICPKQNAERRQGSDPTCIWESFLKWAQIRPELISLMSPEQEEALPCVLEDSTGSPVLSDGNSYTNFNLSLNHEQSVSSSMALHVD